MHSRSLSVYRAPKWGAKIAREALISRDSQGAYTVDTAPVTEVRTIDLFSVLVCADGTTHPVLTAFLRLVDQEQRTNEIPQS